MKENVFFARWFLLITIALPSLLYVSIYIERHISLLMLPILVGPLMVFYRKDLIEFMQDWYSLVRGRKPKRRD